MGYVEDLRKVVGHRPLILVGSIVIILNDEKHVLLQQRTYPHGVWGLPGGLMELTESTEECARREVLEETGLKIGELKLVTVLSGASQYVKVQNGDEFYSVTIVYVTTDVQSNDILLPNEESLALQYFPLDHLPPSMIGSHRTALQTL